MRHVRYEFDIPDATRPLPLDTLGPSCELVRFTPEPLDSSRIVDRAIEDWTPNAGTYGMGGPGFLGFSFGDVWLIIAIWGAAGWFQLDGRPLEDIAYAEAERPEPWLEAPGGPETWARLFVGRRFTDFEVDRHSIVATLDRGGLLTLAADPTSRPPFPNGQVRALELDDDLRRAVFLAPTPEIWV